MLCAFRLYNTVTQSNKVDVRMVCQFMIDNRIMMKKYSIKAFIYQRFNQLEQLKFIVPIGRTTTIEENGAKKYPTVYCLTNRAKLLFNEFSVVVKKYFENELMLPNRINVPRKKYEKSADSSPALDAERIGPV